MTPDQHRQTAEALARDTINGTSALYIAGYLTTAGADVDQAGVLTTDTDAITALLHTATVTLTWPTAPRPVPTRAERITAAREDGRQLTAETTRDALNTMYTVRDQLAAELEQVRAERDRLRDATEQTSSPVPTRLLNQTAAALNVALHHAEANTSLAPGTARYKQRAAELDGCRIALQEATEATTAPAPGSTPRAPEGTIRALRTGLDHAITYLTVTHRSHGIHDGQTPCEGCEVLGDLEQLAAALRRDESATRAPEPPRNDLVIVARALAPEMTEPETDHHYREDAARILTALADAGRLRQDGDR